MKKAKKPSLFYISKEFTPIIPATIKIQKKLILILEGQSTIVLDYYINSPVNECLTNIKPKHLNSFSTEAESTKLADKTVKEDKTFLGCKREKAKKKQNKGRQIKVKPTNPTAKKTDSSSSVNEQHFNFEVGMKIKNLTILKLLGDGTFGRVLEVLDLQNRTRALKVFKPVKKYIKQAKEEASIGKLIFKSFDFESSRTSVVNIFHDFDFTIDSKEYYGILFEKLGMSIYQLLEENSFIGFPIDIIQSIAKQIFESLEFLHDHMHIVHTDLKPENILLAKNDFISVTKTDIEKVSLIHKCLYFLEKPS